MPCARSSPTLLSNLPPLLAAIGAFGLAQAQPVGSSHGPHELEAPSHGAHLKRERREIDLRVRTLATATASTLPFPPPAGDTPAAPLFGVTSFIGDDTRANSKVDVVVWSPKRLFLRWVPGTIEPKETPRDEGGGKVPPADVPMTRAAFNGGFRAVHGAYGAVYGERVLLPLLPGIASVGEREDGSTWLGSWPHPDKTIRFRSVRQNLPPLVEDGRINPRGRPPERWGNVSPDVQDKVHAVRSGICRRRDGLFAYFWGADLSPDALAHAMLHAQCTYGMHLDMNPGLTGFEFCGETNAAGPTKPNDSSGGTRPRKLTPRMSLATFPLCQGVSPRDFFYLVLGPEELDGGQK